MLISKEIKLISRNEVLTFSVCKDFISSVNKKSNEQGKSQLLLNCVIDCSLVDGKLVVYEIQSMFNSLISEEAILALMGKKDHSFDNIFYVFNYGFFDKLGAKTRYKVGIFSDVFKKELTRMEPNIPALSKQLNNKNTLIIFDTPCQSINDARIRQLIKSNNSFYWMGAWKFDIRQSVFNFKHIQRLIMSGSELTPSFVFIENQDVYTQTDVELIKSSLALTDTDFIIIKANNGTKGASNKVLRVEELLPYINSESFKKDYKSDSVILIEQVKNEKVNEAYHTHRYAAGLLPNNQSVCLDVYSEMHPEIDSHIKPEITWLNQPINDANQKSQIDQLLNTIYQLDYSDLILKLLSSETNINRLLGIDFLSKNLDILFSTNFFKNEQGVEMWSISLDLSDSFLESFEKIMLSQADNVRNRMLDLISAILNRHNAEIECKLDDKKNHDIILKLNEIKTLSPKSEEKVVHFSIHYQTGSETFFDKKNTPSNQNVIKDRGSDELNETSPDFKLLG